jgi:peptidoglycan hydrolase-like protein with peptidoglycan-binding domain
MNTFRQLVAGALLVGAALPALADQPVGAMHPEESIPANAPRMTSPGPYDDFTKQIQQKLIELGFDAGPVNGDFGPKTQAALAQFQQASLLPVSGMPDAMTLLELDLQRPASTLEASNLSARDASAAGGTRP